MNSFVGRSLCSNRIQVPPQRLRRQIRVEISFHVYTFSVSRQIIDSFSLCFVLLSNMSTLFSTPWINKISCHLCTEGCIHINEPECNLIEML
jgi:hypothetical protein